MGTKSRQYLCCRVGREWYGISVDQVIEVLTFVALNDVPGAPPHVLGLLTLRDVVMPVVDLRVLFGDAAPTWCLDTPIVALRSAQGAIAIVADDVDDVESAHEVTDPHTSASPFTLGVARIGERLLQILDVSQLRAPAAV